MKKKIGFIGVGIMGAGMINNLKNDHEVVVYNRTKEKAEKLGGVRVVNTPKEVANETEIIFVCVSNDKALKAILYEENGLFKADVEGKTLLDSGTTSIELTEEIKKEAAERNMHFLDAPITGSKLGAENGTLMFMIGGEKDIFDSVVPILESMGKRFVYCGETPGGQKAKHALNMTMSLVLESYLEGMAFGIKAGVPLKAMQEILDNSGAQNAISSLKMKYILERNFEPHFFLELMHKDLVLADADRKKLDLYTPLADKITEIFDEAMKRGKEDVSTIVKTLEEKNNIKFE